MIPGHFIDRSAIRQNTPNSAQNVAGENEQLLLVGCQLDCPRAEAEGTKTEIHSGRLKDDGSCVEERVQLTDHFGWKFEDLFLGLPSPWMARTISNRNWFFRRITY